MDPIWQLSLWLVSQWPRASWKYRHLFRTDRASLFPLFLLWAPASWPPFRPSKGSRLPRGPCTCYSPAWIVLPPPHVVGWHPTLQSPLQYHLFREALPDSLITSLLHYRLALSFRALLWLGLCLFRWISAWVSHQTHSYVPSTQSRAWLRGASKNLLVEEPAHWPETHICFPLLTRCRKGGW